MSLESNQNPIDSKFSEVVRFEINKETMKSA